MGARVGGRASMRAKKLKNPEQKFKKRTPHGEKKAVFFTHTCVKIGYIAQYPHTSKCRKNCLNLRQKESYEKSYEESCCPNEGAG
jgi:hypothetical protein